MSEQQLSNRLRDLSQQAFNQGLVTNTRFLSPAEQSEAEIYLKKIHASYILSGGYKGAERQICILLPDVMDAVGAEDVANPVDAPNAESLFSRGKIGEIIAALRLAVPSRPSLPPGHRDYLGSLLGLGIERDQLGDILVDGHEATVLVLARMAGFILNSLTQVGSLQVQAELVPLHEITVPEQSFKTIRITVASLRLDKIISCGFGLSRTDAADMIRSGLVQLNWLVELRPDRDVAMGSTLSLRGHGRIRLVREEGLSRKDRHILILELFL